MSRRVVPLLAAFAVGAAMLIGIPVATAGASAGRTPGKVTKPVTVRLGYFPNLTHASAIVGVEAGLFKKALGKNRLALSIYNSGSEEVTALFADALDIGYIGPSPTINAWAKSKGAAVRIVSGSASGGASFVVKKNIHSAADLKGKSVASPQLGSTQDLSLRSWLKSKGLKTNTSGGGDVSVLPQENALTLQAFQSGDLVGAWVPEPWATRLITEAGGKVLVDEADLWPDGQFVTANIVVRTKFLTRHPDVVEQVLRGQVAANELIARRPRRAQQLVIRGIKKITGKTLAGPLVAAAFENLTFTNDPIASTLVRSARNAAALGIIEPVRLTGIYDLRLLNKVLRAKNLEEIPKP